MGQVGLEWQTVGFGPMGGAGPSDMLMRNTNTGAFEVYDIVNNQITTAASMGQVGLEWSVAGIVAIRPADPRPRTRNWCRRWRLSRAPTRAAVQTSRLSVQAIQLRNRRVAPHG